MIVIIIIVVNIVIVYMVIKFHCSCHKGKCYFEKVRLFTKPN